jgi:AraC family transcriptional regulator
MYKVFTDTDRNGKHLPKNSNLVNYSMFTELHCQVPFRSFSIKYVSQGCEKYTIRGKKYHREPGQYLLANRFSEGSAIIESTTLVKGICIDVASDLLSEVVASHRRPDTASVDIGLDVFFSSPDFLENQYHAPQTKTGMILRNLDAELTKNPFQERHFTKELFFSLAETIVSDHIPIFKQLQAVKAVKSETRKDLWKKVKSGKEYMDAYFNTHLDIASIAKESGISEYHFFRLFKTVFGESPYKYIIQKRLDFAEKILIAGNTSISEIAIESGFSDIHSFSKAFKKQYGIPPSALLK